jgi:glycosyltransferase involved in cell wall biosynthesis
MTKPLISLLLPTRGRSTLVERLFKSIVETTSQLERVEVILYIDEDDTGSHYLDSEDVSVVRIIGPRMSMGAYNSACLARAQSNIIILINDDMVIQTPGWDRKIIEMDAEFTDKIYLAYSNDLNKGGSLCVFPILSRRTCELLVEPYPVAYQGAFIDIHLFDIFKRLQHAGFDRIRYLDDVVFEHLHYRMGKAVYDETYKERGRFEDDRTFISMVDDRSTGAKRLLSELLGEVLPTFKKSECYEYSPYGIFGAASYFSRKFIFDKELPLRWRGFLWYWFIGRYLAAHGYLWPFVR